MLDSNGIVDEDMIAKGREVEEWLMGSGGSFTAATTNGSESLQARSKEELGVSGAAAPFDKIKEQPEEEEQKTLDEWMFKTVVRPSQQKCPNKPKEDEPIEREDYECEIEEFLQQEDLGFQNLNQYMDLMDSILEEQAAKNQGFF